MNNISKNLFKAIFEGKWASIEYNNKDQQTTKYWIGIKKIIINDNVNLVVDGLHIPTGKISELHIDYQRISFCSVIDGTFYRGSEKLKQDIEENNEKYQVLFNDVANLKILNYLLDCNKLDCIPYIGEYSLIDKIDDSKVKTGDFSLSDEQYLEIIKEFQIFIKDHKQKNIVQLCLNILSINTKKGLYVLAYRDLHFDVVNKCFKASDEVHLCNEFNVNQESLMSIRHFISEDDMYLTNKFEENLSIIEDKIIEYGNGKYNVDDIPYVIAMHRDIPLSLDKEYQYITNSVEEGLASYPIKAFFGQLTKIAMSKKKYSITLMDNKINLDQLLAIHNAMKYPITYVQGPPGTGKTNTIINTILTAFFNKKSLLFSSYNNHPINSVFDKLTHMQYNNREIPFPILRIGNNDEMLKTLDYIKCLLDKTQNIEIFNETLDKYGDSLENNSAKLTQLMQKYERILDLKERKETIEKLLESSDDFNFRLELQSKQLNDINDELKIIGEVTNQQAIDLVLDDGFFQKYLYYISASYIKKLLDVKYNDLLDIVYMDDDDERVNFFNKYISDEENLINLMKVFPIIACTCISCHKIGSPNLYFDMVVIDEASQCNNAVSLVPILRGKSLLLVGDPQQLNPVIQLDPKNNEMLKKKYNISNEYDYINNSIYKTYLAADSISQEILLSHHYRCSHKIIDFCNKKYYNNKLSIKTDDLPDSLVYVDIKNNCSAIKNVSSKEADYIIEYLQNNPNKNIGIITPFVNQKLEIESRLKDYGISGITCGTVHSFQGDEKDEIIFSLALSDKTNQRTYEWLKNNKELINVGVSRAKKKLIILSSMNQINRLRFASNDSRDDIYDLIQYVQSNGTCKISTVVNKSRALGIKPYSSETEEAFMINLNHALGNILRSDKRCTVKKEVAIASVFTNDNSYNSLFYSGRFDFVVYQKEYGTEIPILAIELDGKEHYDDEIVKKRDAKKNKICEEHGFELIRIDNTYARRYNYLKDILIDYFKRDLI